jgi:Family of unknown function (DUF6263)
MGVSGSAQGQVQLEWKFTPGDKFYLEHVMNVKQVVEAGGMKQPLDALNTTVYSIKVVKVAPGQTVLEQKIESMKVKGGTPDQAKVSEKMVGSVFTITLNDKGLVTKVEGFDELIKKLAEGDEGIAKQLKTVLTDDTMKAGIEQAFGFIPGKPVNNGDTWKRQMRWSMGVMGAIVQDMEYTYTGKAKDGEEVAVKGTVSYEVPKTTVPDQPFKVVKGEFKTEEAKGTLIFDPTLGRLVRLDFKAKLTGSMTLSKGEQTVTMDVKQEMETKIRVLKDLPRD